MNRREVRTMLEPAALQFDAQGRPYCALYGDLYSSRDGALGQARHVFLAGNGLPQAWSGRRHFTIVETGFGLGTNFIATWQAWRADPARPGRLHFFSVEGHPLRRDDLQALAARESGEADEGALRALRTQLAERWPPPIAGLHRIEFEAGAVCLSLVLGDAATMIPELQLGADAFYLDGFAPDRNPELWTVSLLRALARLARPGATFATYTCARAVRESLAACGFDCAVAPGFGSKREMLRGSYKPRWKMRRHEPPAAYDGPRTALVLGAGLAGCAVAAALVARGWQVWLLDRAGIATQASGLPGGLLAPLLSADDNLAARLVRAGNRYSLAALLGQTALPATSGDVAAAPVWISCGVFEQAEDEAHEQHLRRLLAAQGWPSEYAAYCPLAEAAARLGRAPRRGGVWFEQGAVVSAARWCAAWTRAACTGADPAGASLEHGRLAVEPGFDVVSIDRVDHGWEVRDRDGATRQAPVLVLANAGGLAALHDVRGANLQSIGGRLTLLQPPALADLRCAIGGDGYIVPPLLGPAAVGATYEFETPASESSGDVHFDDQAAVAGQRSNLARLERLLEQAPAVAVGGSFAARRCVAPDRMPLAGCLVDEDGVSAAAAALRGARTSDLPRHRGLYVLAALGSRGLALAPLLAEHVAAQICGEPAPLEAALAAAVDPGRHALRRLR